MGSRQSKWSQWPGWSLLLGFVFLSASRQPQQGAKKALWVVKPFPSSRFTSNASESVCGQEACPCGCKFVAKKNTEDVCGQGAGTYTSTLLATEQNKETTSCGPRPSTPPHTCNFFKRRWSILNRLPGYWHFNVETAYGHEILNRHHECHIHMS